MYTFGQNVTEKAWEELEIVYADTQYGRIVTKGRLSGPRGGKRELRQNKGFLSSFSFVFCLFVFTIKIIAVCMLTGII